MIPLSLPSVLGAACTPHRLSDLGELLQVLGPFLGLSLFSIGGGNTVLPEMHLRAVNGYHWLTDGQFADIFSISQAAPGPSILIVSLVGYAAGLQVSGVLGGIVGGLVATVAMIVSTRSPTNASWWRCRSSSLRPAWYGNVR